MQYKEKKPNLFLFIYKFKDDKYCYSNFYRDIIIS